MYKKTIKGILYSSQFCGLRYLQHATPMVKSKIFLVRCVLHTFQYMYTHARVIREIGSRETNCEQN